MSCGHLPVDGASIYYEIRGTHGPLWLFISAGMGTAHAHELTSAQLSQRFRVLTYDRRGFARSRSNNQADDNTPPTEVVARNARDAASLIRHFRSREEPAYIYGSCFGGTIGLQLLQTDPELVKLAIIHEPGIPLLVSEPALQPILAKYSSVPETFANSGGRAAAALVTSMIANEVDRTSLLESEAYDDLVTRSAQHMPHHFAHESRAAATHTVDWNRLYSQRDKLVLAIGIESTLPLQRDPVQCIAARLGLRLVETPGAHFPFASDRKRTVEQLVSLVEPTSPTLGKLANPPADIPVHGEIGTSRQYCCHKMSQPAPIAVIGIAFRLPGDTNDLDQLAELLYNGRSGHGPVPKDRWNVDGFYSPQQNASEAIATKHGYFLNDDISKFDPRFFQIARNEACSMDPKQRLLLQTTYHALENAGIPMEQIKGSNTSVHVSTFTYDYERMAYRDLKNLPGSHVTGTGSAIIANRISYFFDLKGPSFTLDTGCVRADSRL